MVQCRDVAAAIRSRIGVCVGGGVLIVGVYQVFGGLVYNTWLPGVDDVPQRLSQRCAPFDAGSAHLGHGPDCRIVVDHPGKTVNTRHLYEQRWLEELTGKAVVTIEACVNVSCEVCFLVSPLHSGRLTCAEAAILGSAQSAATLIHIGQEDTSLKDARRLRLVYGRFGRVFRNYYVGFFSDMPRVHWLPLGYGSTGFDWSRPPPSTPAAQRHNQAWFIGNNGNNPRRSALVKDFERQASLKVVGQTQNSGFGSGDREFYVRSMADSVFCLAPPGHSPESFRLYEALQAGCVPVMLDGWASRVWNDFGKDRPYLARIDQVKMEHAQELQTRMNATWQHLKVHYSRLMRALP